MVNSSKKRSFSQSLEKHNWSAYEKNLLLRAGYSLAEIDALDYRPIEYITGFARFLDYKFLVNHNVLIPRIESEGLVKMAVYFLSHQVQKTKQAQFTLADIGTGAGNIAISLFLESLAKQFTLQQLFLSDISTEALKVAQTNLERLVVAQHHSQFKFITSDLLSAYPQKKLDLIIANLPYIPHHLLADIKESVLRFEPKLAVDGGSDGLVLIRKLIKQADDFLSPQGLMIFEIDSRVKITAKKLNLKADKYNFLVSQDQFGKQRYLLLATHPDKYLQQIAESVKLN